MTRYTPHVTLAVAALSALLVGAMPQPALQDGPTEIHRYDRAAMTKLVASIIRK